MKRLGSTGTATWAVGIALLAACFAAAPARAADGPPDVAVGWADHARGPLRLDIHATAHGAALQTATVLLDGAPVSSGPLDCDPGCQVGSVLVTLDTTNYTDGIHHLVVTVSDAAGLSTSREENVEIDNADHNHTTATLTIGSDVTIPQPSGPGGNNNGGGVLGGSATSCASPKLSMLLAQKPVRIKKGVAVLYRGKQYRFTGRLTCVVRGKRVSAPKKTKIQLFAIVKGKSVSKGGATVGSGGKITIRTAATSSRTLEFRFTNADKKVSRVRIKVQTVKAPKKHKKG
jgi:hypothetical protein